MQYYVMEIALDRNYFNVFLEGFSRNPILSTTLIKYNMVVLEMFYMISKYPEIA